MDTITGEGVASAGHRVLPPHLPELWSPRGDHFGYGGEVSPRPTARPTLRELGEYNYFRRNRAGVQREWWFHRSGCRAWFIAERDTTTNEVLLTELPGHRGNGGAA